MQKMFQSTETKKALVKNWIETGKLDLVGLTGSTSGTLMAPLILLEGFESKVLEEDIVVIKNKNDSYILAVCRQGTGIDENLKVGAYTPSLSYVRSTGKRPSAAKESYHFYLVIMGRITDKGLDRNEEIISPGSPVYQFSKPETNPLSLMVDEDCSERGFYRSHEEWKVPFKKTFIPYHIAVFGQTGCGKSFLTKNLLVPLLRSSGYNILILDWEGIDYTEHFRKINAKVIPLYEVALDTDAIAEYLCEKMGHFGYTGEKRETNEIRDAIDDFLMKEDWKKISQEEFKIKLKNHAKVYLEHASSNRNVINAWIRKLEKGLEKLTKEHIKTVYGEKRPSEIVKEAENHGVVVLDMSMVEAEEKLSVFISIGSNILERVQKGESLKLALIIDEAPQYAPWEPKGLQKDATELIKNLCATGRKHELCMVLISQGIAGDIGINAAVRRNLNTQFIGQIHPLDLEEAMKWLSPYGIRNEHLLYLNPGQFYFIGKMNPSPIPLLISFKIGEGI
jgi:hypothetical protein